MSKLREMLVEDEVSSCLNLEVEQRLGNMLRNFPVQDVEKKESEYRAQLVSFCKAVVEEQQHPDSELCKECGAVADMVLDIVSLGDIVALKTAMCQAENQGSVVAFFTKHKVGQALSKVSAEFMEEGAARVKVEEALQTASCALKIAREKATIAEEELSGPAAMYLEKAKLVNKEAADLKKQGSHTAKMVARATQELDAMNKDFWNWLLKGLKAELLNTILGVLENCGSLLGPKPEDLGRFSIQDVEEVVQCKEIVMHPLWKTVSTELNKDKKVLKLFEFYAKLAEQACSLVKFALARNTSTQVVFGGAALPAKPPPDALRKFKDLPGHLQELNEKEDYDVSREWKVLLDAVDAELGVQQNAGFFSLAELIKGFVEGRSDASKARLEEVKLMVPQKCEGRAVLEASFEAECLLRKCETQKHQHIQIIVPHDFGKFVFESGPAMQGTCQIFVLDLKSSTSILLHDVEIFLVGPQGCRFLPNLCDVPMGKSATHRSYPCGCQRQRGQNRLYFEWLRCRGTCSRLQKPLRPARPCWKAAAWKVMNHGDNGGRRNIRGC